MLFVDIVCDCCQRYWMMLTAVRPRKSSAANTIRTRQRQRLMGAVTRADRATVGGKPGLGCGRCLSIGGCLVGGCLRARGCLGLGVVNQARSKISAIASARRRVVIAEVPDEADDQQDDDDRSGNDGRCVRLRGGRGDLGVLAPSGCRPNSAGHLAIAKDPAVAAGRS